MADQDHPQSLHKIGLEVQDSFVSEYSERDEDLPWIVEQDIEGGRYDIFREDLERILHRVYKMQDKVVAAANFSIHKSFLQSKKSVNAVSRESLRSRDSRKSSLHSFFEDDNEEDDYIPRAPRQLHHLPKHKIEQILPITRTNASKSYPHRSDRWTENQPKVNKVMPSESLVNQRDLKDQTKLRLFILKRKTGRVRVKRDLVTPSSVTSSRSFLNVPPTAQFIGKITASGDNPLTFFQRERLNDLLSNGLNSPRISDRVTAARSLATLGLAAVDEVCPILTASIINDKSSTLRFEAAKAVFALGEFPDVALKEMTLNLLQGNKSMKMDIMNKLYIIPKARNLYLSLMENEAFNEFLEVLHDIALRESDGNELGYLAAVCLGMLCGNHHEQYMETAIDVLENVAKTTEQPDHRAQALEVLVRQLNHSSEEVLRHVIKQLDSAIKWNDRLSAALLIGYMGPSNVFELMDEADIFAVLQRKLWDDSKREVRLAVSQTFTSLGMRPIIMERLEQDLRDKSEEIRSQAVISISATGIRSDTTLRFLIEMLGLDSSDYVRLQLMRTFHALELSDIRVVRALRERERCGGRLAKAAGRILTSMNIPLHSSQSKKRHNNTFSSQTTPMREDTAGASSWLTSPSRYTSMHEPIQSQNQRYSSMNKMEVESPSYRESRRASVISMLSGKVATRKQTPQIEILSTAVRKSPFKRPDSSRQSVYGEAQLLADATDFF